MSNRLIRPIEEIDRKAIIAEVRRVLDEHVVEDENGFYSTWVELKTNVLQDVLTLLTAPAEDLLESDAGLALANAAWGEGAAAWRRYSFVEGPASPPVSPYSAPLLRRIRERGDPALES